MNYEYFPNFLFFVVLLYSATLTSELSGHVGLTALNDSAYATSLYLKLRNEGAPSERDPAAQLPLNRKRICEEMANSGFFPVVDADLFQDLMLPKYSTIFRQLFNTPDAFHYVYDNAYTVQEIVEAAAGQESDRSTFSEYVFVCLSRDWIFGEIKPFFVSKEYNVGPVGQPYKPGRFVFTGLELWQSPVYNYMLLAEEPSTALVQPEFNVELYFLRMRKYINRVKEHDIDPLCKLVSEDEADANNQHFRFCLVVGRSLYLKNFIHYPGQNSYGCVTVEISFKTPEAQQLAAGKTYWEQMTPCFCKRCADEADVHFYLSRAYRSNSLLVYFYDDLENKVYLENLSNNVAIVDELNSFDFVEE